MASRFEIIPAIDLIGGRVVRLTQGDFEQEDRYSDDPVAVAQRFAAAGTSWLHVVDLDGARAGQPRQQTIIDLLVNAVPGTVRCEVAGGLRTEESVDLALAAGAARVVIGTAAIRDSGFAGRLVQRHGPERIAAAIDVRDGLAIGEAWRSGASGPAMHDAIARLLDVGIRVVEVTAIDRDGGLGGPDLELLETAVVLGVDVIASAGIRSVADLEAVRSIGCVGAIVGRALYDGSLGLASALALENAEAS